MGFWKTFFGERVESDIDHIDAELSATFVKEYDYSASQTRSTMASVFTLAEQPVVWTEPKSYSDLAVTALQNSISRACILQRAIAISNIDLATEGNEDAKLVMSAPNVKDGDIQTFLKNAETVLSIGGKLPLFWDNSINKRPQVHAFRPDLVQNDIKNSRYLYNPRALDGQFDAESADFIFNYDPLTGVTTSAFKRVGKKLVSINGGLQLISYHDPRNSTEGMSPVSPVIRHIDLLKAIETLLSKKFGSGGTRAGFYEVPAILTEAEIETVRAQFNKLNPTGAGNVMPAGVKFTAAQMTLQELSVLEIRAQLIAEICTALQVPAEMIGQATSTYANVRGKDKIFYRNFIGPEAHWLAGQLQAGLRQYVDKKATVVVDETSVQHLEEDRLERASKMAAMKCFEADEIRAVLGYKPAPEGAEFVGAQVNMGQPEEKPKGEVAFNADAGDRGDKND